MGTGRSEVLARPLGFSLEDKGQVIAALESFMMAASGEEVVKLDENAAAGLARETLAYHLATEDQRRDLEWLFQEIATHIQSKVPGPEQRRAYARTLFGVRTSLAIHEWTRGKIKELASADSDEDLLKVIWPCYRLVFRIPCFINALSPRRCSNWR